VIDFNFTKLYSNPFLKLQQFKEFKTCRFKKTGFIKIGFITI